MRKPVQQVAIIAALTVAATISISSPAWADGYATYENYRSLKCLDSNRSGDVYTHGCNGGNNQSWYLQFISGTSHYLKNRATGRCLDANSSNDVYTLSCNGGTNQRWRRVRPANKVYGQWINVQTGKCLTGSNLSGTRAVFTTVCQEATEDKRDFWANTAS